MVSDSKTADLRTSEFASALISKGKNEEYLKHLLNAPACKGQTNENECNSINNGFKTVIPKGDIYRCYWSDKGKDSCHSCVDAPSRDDYASNILGKSSTELADPCNFDG